MIPRIYKDVQERTFISVTDYGAKGDGETDDTAAIKSAIATGKTVYFPQGVYVCSDEITLTTQGQRLFGAGMGGGYAAVGFPNYAFWKDCATLLFKDPANAGVRYRKTRYTHRISANSPRDPSMSACINVQALGVTIEHLAIRLDITVPETTEEMLADSIDNLGADWDIGIFFGSRVGCTLNSVAVLGPHRKANIWIDATQATNLNRFRDYRTGEPFPNDAYGEAADVSGIAGADKTNFTNVYTSGGLWGIRLQGPRLSANATEASTYYDEELGLVNDWRCGFGASDFSLYNCYICGGDHHTKRRYVDFPTTVSSDLRNHVDGGGAMYVDGYCGNIAQAIQGHRYIATRFHGYGLFCVLLDTTNRDAFIGCHGELRVVYSHDGTDISPASSENCFGNLAKTDRAQRVRVIASALSYYNAYFPLKFYDYYILGDNAKPNFFGGKEMVVMGEDNNAVLKIESGTENSSIICLGSHENPFAFSMRYYQRGFSGQAISTLDVRSEKLDGTVATAFRIRPTDGYADRLFETHIPFVPAAGSNNELTLGDGNHKWKALYTGVFRTSTAESAAPYVRPEVGLSVRLGVPTAPWSHVYAASGTVETSDARMKSNVAAVDDAALDAWGAVRWSQYQFNDSIKEKGEGARLHTGIVAQTVDAAFKAKGLDASRYGLFCYDKWDDEYENSEVVDVEEIVDETGRIIEPAKTHIERKKVNSAGDRYGIRYEEALAMEAAYQRRRADRLEARIAKLEQLLSKEAEA